MKKQKQLKTRSAKKAIKVFKRYLTMKALMWVEKNTGKYFKMQSKANALTLVGLCVCATANAQSVAGEQNGKVILQVFTNFHTGFGDQKDDRGFDLDRAYLGYQYNFGKGLSAKGVVDCGAKTDGYDRVVYIKNAQMTWKTGGLTLNGGLISTTQFNMVEKFWGLRYMYKSFQDAYSFGSSADLGISAEYKLAKWLSVDGIVVNGEGYKKIQSKDGLLYGLGATVTPAKGLTLRAYASLNEQQDEGAKDIFNLSTFAGYKGKGYSIGAEYNYMANTKGVEDNDRSGFSVYGTVTASKCCDVFARFDDISSKDDWAGSDDESMVLVGAQFKCGKYVKLAPNFRMGFPKEGDGNEYSAYVSCYFGI